MADDLVPTLYALRSFLFFALLSCWQVAVLVPYVVDRGFA